MDKSEYFCMCKQQECCQPAILIKFVSFVDHSRHIDSYVVSYCTRKLTCFLGNPTSVLDVIPGDMVLNAMIVAMVTHANLLSTSIMLDHH
ncbi:hypothetical protein FRX31_015904 [Thalictrum thalictroides]|uniref:Fatty acyl-CoA reductase n=1 Tax=Thalictrum thalictroides TaxID=46969 RepID=A0A7J6WC48_THATH|nr:hypothetical protein FRX31_015904 [Thalictrum thalictroides]